MRKARTFEGSFELIEFLGRAAASLLHKGLTAFVRVSIEWC